MSRQFWNEGLVAATAAGTAIAASTTETILFPAVSIPGNYLQDGRHLRLRAFGAYGTTATPTLIFSVRLGGVGGTILSKSAAAVLSSGVGGGASMTVCWSLEACVQVRSNGSAGTLFTMGEAIMYLTVPTAGTVTAYGMPMVIASGSTGGTTPVAVAADLTATADLVLTALWGTNNAANSIRGDMLTIEALN